MEGGVRDTIHLQSGKVGLEEDLGTTEAFVSNDDNVTVGKLEGLLECRRFGGLLHLFFKVDGDEAERFFDVTHDFSLGCGGEGVSTLGEDFHEVVGQVPAGEVETDDGVGEGVSLVDGHGVRDSVSRIEDASSGASGGVEGEHGLDVDVHGGDIKGLEHDLGHTLAVGLGVLGGFGEQHGVRLGGDAELVVEGVVPDLLHVVPVGDDAMLDGVLQGEHAAFGLCFVSDVGVSLLHAHLSDEGIVRRTVAGWRAAVRPSRTSLTIIPGWRALPISEGNTDRGASSPAKPAVGGRDTGRSE